MENYKKGGYTILDLESSTIYADSVKALDSNKPVVVYDGTNKPYFADSISLSGTSVVITKGGKTITIANDNTITNVGDIQNHLYYHPIDVWGANSTAQSGLSFSCLILNGLSTAFNSFTDFVTYCRNNSIASISPVSGSYNTTGNKRLIISWIDIESDKVNLRGHYYDDETDYLRLISINDAVFTDLRIDDPVNKLI